MKTRLIPTPVTSFLLVGIFCVSILLTGSASAQVSYPDGTLIRPKGFSNVFVIQKGMKHSIRNIDIFNSYGYKWEDVQEVDQSIEQSYSSARLAKLKNDYKVYFLNTNLKFWIRTPEAFLSAGFKSVEDEVIDLNKYEMDSMKDMKVVQRGIKSDRNPEFYDKVDDTVFVITPFGTKRALRSAAIFESYGYTWSEIGTIPYNLVDNLPATSLIRAKNDYKVYNLENGVRHWIVSTEAFQRNGFCFDQVEEVTALDLNLYQEGETIK